MLLEKCLNKKWRFFIESHSWSFEKTVKNGFLCTKIYSGRLYFTLNAHLNWMLSEKKMNKRKRWTKCYKRSKVSWIWAAAKTHRHTQSCAEMIAINWFTGINNNTIHSCHLATQSHCLLSESPNAWCSNKHSFFRHCWFFVNIFFFCLFRFICIISIQMRNLK